MLEVYTPLNTYVQVMKWKKYSFEDFEKINSWNIQQNPFMNTFPYWFAHSFWNPYTLHTFAPIMFAQTLFVCVWSVFSICANCLKKNRPMNLLCKQTNILTVYVAVWHNLCKSDVNRIVNYVSFWVFKYIYIYVYIYTNNIYIYRYMYIYIHYLWLNAICYRVAFSQESTKFIYWA